MRRPWRSLFLPVALLLTLMLGPWPLHSLLAQSLPNALPDTDKDSDFNDEEYKPVPILNVSVTLDASGKADVQAFYYLADKSSLPPSEIKGALQSALGCALQDTPGVSPRPGFYSGSCTIPSSINGFVHQGSISTRPLQAFSCFHGITSTSVHLELPEADIEEAIPDDQPVFPRSPRLPAPNRSYLRSFFSYVGSAEKPLPPQIVFRCGYASATLQRDAVILVLALLSPLALFLWLGRRALSADTTDKAVVWFSYMRWLRWILNASLIGWWVALGYCHAET